jgi:hypothetical protein
MSATISRFPAAGNEALIATLRLLALLRRADRVGLRADAHNRHRRPTCRVWSDLKCTLMRDKKTQGK